MRKNVVLCFDQVRHHQGAGGDTNATALFKLLERSDHQIVWYHAGTPRRARQRDALADARAVVGEAYGFLAGNFEPDDRVLVFGAGRGGYYAQALTHLIGTFGILAARWAELVDFVVASYGVPRTQRSSREWAMVEQVADGLECSIVDVAFLGLWDALRPSALPTPPSAPALNVRAGRHAIAIDGGPVGQRLVSVGFDRVDQVWFRGGHCDVAGGAGACAPLTEIALDWVLDGARAAGAVLHTDHVVAAPAPDQADALAGSARNLSMRRLPTDARVHASVDVYLRAHPDYWRRLPDRIVWSDQGWLARGERLVPAAVTPAVVHAELAAVGA
ncbi:DUF2235 domain-containing protein [Mycolicibacterium sp. P9-64]|uniref:phospholipase effector Tle1 domain-containing protein n=1 Tax=Mycolicibacterium sp. P9-64 TaxID=2024612 RepID=UPI001F5BAE4A|nr:DUF2235 domain-containing protein [Mycolicibacterium sp. P9-64]